MDARKKPAGAAAPAAAAPTEPPTTLRRIMTLLAPYRREMVLVVAAVILAAALTSLAPFLIKAVFDDALFPSGGGKPDLALLTWLALGLIAIPLASAAIGVGQTYLTSKIGNAAVSDLRSGLFAHLQKMDLGFFTAIKAGAMQARMAGDVNGVRTVLTGAAPAILSNAATVVAAFVAMLILSWQLTIIALVLMPIYILVQAQLEKRRRLLAQRTQESLDDLTAAADDALSVSGILLAKVFNRAGLESSRTRAENTREINLQVRASIIGQTFLAAVGALFAITPAIIYLVAGHVIGPGPSLTAGTLVAFTVLQARLQMPLMQLTRVSADIETSLSLFRRVFEYLDLKPAIRESPIAVPIDAQTARGEVQLRDVWFAYPAPRRLSDDSAPSWVPEAEGRAGDRFGLTSTVAGTTVTADSAVTDEQQAETAIGAPDPLAAVRAVPTPPAEDGFRWTLAGLDLHVQPGQFAAIVGPSGSGKTTASYLIPRFYDVDRGAVLIDGVDVRDITRGSLAGVVGLVTQEPYLFHGTIRDNLAYARPTATQAEIEQAAREANIHDRILNLKHGYDTIAGEGGCHLSAGEKQRLAIARVLLMNPRVLILDEATSALDTETERLVQQAIDRATRNRTTIAIAHRLSTIMKADVIFGLDEGRIVEQGTHDELLAHGGLYWQLYTEQFGAGRVEARLADGVKFIDGTVMPSVRSRVRADVPC